MYNEDESNYLPEYFDISWGNFAGVGDAESYH